MIPRTRLQGAIGLLVAASALLQSPVFAAAPVVPPPRIAGDPWIIDSLVVIHDPIEVGDVIIVDGGALHVIGVPEPGLRVAGNLWAIGSGELVVLTDRSGRVLSGRLPVPDVRPPPPGASAPQR